MSPPKVATAMSCNGLGQVSGTDHCQNGHTTSKALRPDTEKHPRPSVVGESWWGSLKAEKGPADFRPLLTRICHVFGDI